ncbi:hypothetical protein BG910_01885 [Neisseria chenwenguii]|uniref:Uncharacterized protein n=2 Tax=Neisseria chenwenguii TaxID=1853278 RepID=A0A220RZK8_9NEIS|nr:hypothetical protein BG910_01885 [Neisseria chenwenguii]
MVSIKKLKFRTIKGFIGSYKCLQRNVAGSWFFSKSFFKEIKMKELKLYELEQVAGGGDVYDFGKAVGRATRSWISNFQYVNPYGYINGNYA